MTLQASHADVGKATIPSSVLRQAPDLLRPGAVITAIPIT
jgi:hypothetical protein